MSDLLTSEFANYLKSQHIDEHMSIREIIIDNNYKTELKPDLFRFLGLKHFNYEAFLDLDQDKFIEHALCKLMRQSE